MYHKSAPYYDALYTWKDYPAEADRLHALIQQHKRSPGNALLDVACGTGKHLTLLKDRYAVEGLDLDRHLLRIARERLPDVTLHQGDMSHFDLACQFDVITCLFSAIGHACTVDKLNCALDCMSLHVKPGGVVIVEPWIMPDQFFAGKPHMLTVDQPDLKITRMDVSRVENGISILDFHYMVATPAGVDYFTERLELGLFTDEQYRAAFKSAGLDVIFDTEGLMGRGLYIGTKAS